jgi:integrase
MLLLTTGMRPGEAFGLKWGDIKDGKIHIQRTLFGKAKAGAWMNLKHYAPGVPFPFRKQRLTY